MSLRSFHIVLMLSALACFGFLAYWAGQRAMAGPGGQNAALAVGSGACFLVGAGYLAWFLKHTRTPRA